MTYKCIRCGYETIIKTNMKNHLNRKKFCEPILQDILPSENESLIFNNPKQLKSVQCIFCKKDYSRPDNRKRHEEICSERSDEHLQNIKLRKRLNKCLSIYVPLFIERNDSGFFYIIHEREYVRMRESIYKIGMTNQDIFSRFSQYPKGSILCFSILIKNALNFENKVKKRFPKKFKRGLGNERFGGELSDMIKEILTL